jgi:hypothetical protein
MNKIPETQLEPIQLKRLAAQRQLYSDAKFILAVQINLSVLGPPVLAFLVAYRFLPAVWAAIFGITLTCLFLLFDSHQKSLKEKAAKIQELFDCKVLELKWRELMVDSRLETEIVEQYALKYKSKGHDYNELQNWYPIDVGQLPLHLGRIICQRANCWWDAQLRRRYAKWVVGSVLIILTAVVTCLGVIGGLTFEKVILAVVNPLMPAFVLGRRQYKVHTESAMRLDKLKRYAEGLWDKAVKGATPEELTCNSRDLQDEIYHHRRTNSPVFDWLYNLLKNKDEELMNKTANELVNEALESLQK